jgi:competence protein ComFC
MGPFRDPLKRLIHQMKYQHRWPVAETLADRMLHQPRIRELLDQTDILVPMPLHWARQIGRGFNQADAVAKRLSQKTGILLARPIKRLRNTAPQTSMKSRAARRLNVRNAFALRASDKLAGKRVTIVDDVLTTASTIKAAARVLKEADPLCINALVMAIGDPRGRGFETV